MEPRDLTLRSSSEPASLQPQFGVSCVALWEPSLLTGSSPLPHQGNMGYYSFVHVSVPGLDDTWTG
jgi:hypothetical protein